MEEGLKTSFKGKTIQYMFVFYINMRNSGTFTVFSIDIVRQSENVLLLFFGI